MSNEPTYVYRKGEGWVPSNILQEILIHNKPCEVIDRRTDPSKPGVYRYQLWLVNVKTSNYPDETEVYTYTGWVDNWMGRAWNTVEELQRYLTQEIGHASLLKREGINHRILIVDRDSGNFWGLL